MKKQLALLAVMLLAAMSAFAQITHTSQGAVDKNAEQILSKAAKLMNNGAHKFNVKMTNRDASKSETMSMDASVLYNGGCYRIKMDKQELICDGTTLWMWNKEASEVTINKADQADMPNPATLLSSYNKQFRCKFIRTEQDGTAVIDLTPKESRSYYKIRVLINSKTNIVKSMTMHNYDGSESEFKLSAFGSATASETDFSFSKEQNPSVEVIDMR